MAVAEAQPSLDRPPGPRVLGRCSLPPSAGRFTPRTQCRLLEDSPELLAQEGAGRAVTGAASTEHHWPWQSGIRISVESWTYLTEDGARRGAGRRVGPHVARWAGQRPRTLSQSVRAAVPRPHPRVPHQDASFSQFWGPEARLGHRLAHLSGGLSPCPLVLMSLCVRVVTPHLVRTPTLLEWSTS